ncbi:MAG: acyl-CoA dehydrogenase, partial [Mycobacteriaceae bacterium]|nr:acyl-CoA dehydrogenase [Mycobacteriaceae bacterium]
MQVGSAAVTDEQDAARELVRSWASGAGACDSVRGVEDGRPDDWRAVFDGAAGLGLFGIAVAEDSGGVGGSIADLCAMVEEAARELIPGPVATTALATLVVADPALLGALAAGQLTAGAALTGDLHEDSGVISGTADVLGADASGLVLLPVGDHVVSVDVTANPGVTIEPLEATDFSRTLSRVTLDRAPATRLAVTRRRFTDLAAALLAAESAGVARWTLDTAADYAKVREQFGKPIGSFQAVKHLCAEMLLRCQQSAVAAADAAVALAGDDEGQSSVAAAVAAAAGIAAATANAKD